MKVLFLDIDGVANCEKTFQTIARKSTPYPLDQTMAFMIGKIWMCTGCEIVLSSSWRHDKKAVEAVANGIAPVLDITGNSHLVDYEDKPRGHEIQTWLDAHPEVEKYAILDDDSDMLDSQLPNFFKTSWKTGITEDIMNKVIEHLGAE